MNTQSGHLAAELEAKNKAREKAYLTFHTNSLKDLNEAELELKGVPAGAASWAREERATAKEAYDKALQEIREEAAKRKEEKQAKYKAKIKAARADIRKAESYLRNIGAEVPEKPKHVAGTKTTATQEGEGK